jgi:hypothetical protein
MITACTLPPRSGNGFDAEGVRSGSGFGTDGRDTVGGCQKTACRLRVVQVREARLRLSDRKLGRRKDKKNVVSFFFRIFA